MQSLVDLLAVVLDAARRGSLIVAGVLAAIGGLDWLVRTRRLSPFGPVGRFMRRFVDPLLAPIEKRVVRAGGMPANAPWWALAVVMIGGIALITLLDFLRQQLAMVAAASAAGPRGLYQVLVIWTIAVLQLALIVRVVLSWLPINPYKWYGRLSHALTEWWLGPIRRLLPRFGAIDISPLVGWFALILLQSLLLRIG